MHNEMAKFESWKGMYCTTIAQMSFGCSILLLHWHSTTIAQPSWGCTGIALTEFGVGSGVGGEANKEYLPLPAGLRLFCPQLHFALLWNVWQLVSHFTTSCTMYFNMLKTSIIGCHHFDIRITLHLTKYENPQLIEPSGKGD